MELNHLCPQGASGLQPDALPFCHHSMEESQRIELCHPFRWYCFQDSGAPLPTAFLKIYSVNYSPVSVSEGLYHQIAIIRLSAQPDRSRWSATVLFGLASVWSRSEYFIGLLPVSFRCPQLPRHVDLMTGTSSTLGGALRRSAYSCDCSFTNLEGHTRFELVTCVSKTQVISVSPTALKKWSPISGLNRELRFRRPVRFPVSPIGQNKKLGYILPTTNT